MNEIPLVSISCIAYNQEKYIRECLDGFVMQKTNFPFEVLIHDDASTDRTAEIIREYAAKYPEIIKPICQTENQHSKKVGSINARFNFARAQGKYIALCEGDDFWTDPRKLQIQFDFMESHPDYALCMHDRYVLDYFRKVCYCDAPAKKQPEQGMAFLHSILTDELYYPTQTMFFRRDMYYKREKLFLQDTAGAPMGDFQLVFHLAHEGNVKIIKRRMAVYRCRAGSATNWEDEAKKRAFAARFEQKVDQILVANHYLEWSAERQKKIEAAAQKKPVVFRLIPGVLRRLKMWVGKINFISYQLSRKIGKSGTDFPKL